MSVGGSARHRTALSRSELSRPVRLAFDAGLITAETIVLDYGCGRGGDVRSLAERGVRAVGWDPMFAPDAPRERADVVNLGYVVNVIEHPGERAETLRLAWALASNLLIVSGRLAAEARDLEGEVYEDGVLTRLGTFQKFYSQEELRGWIDETLGAQSLPAGPGVFYVFREEAAREAYVASRYRRQIAPPRLRRSDRLFEEHRDVLKPLMEFVALRGRLPEDDEFGFASDVAERFGNVRRAFDVVRRITGAEQWERIREERAQDLLVYMALGKFDGRPKFSALPAELRRDIKAFFSTYTRACKRADELLFSVGKPKMVADACRASAIGKLTPSALYIHMTAFPVIPDVLRIYEGCARRLIGAVPEANIVKLHHDGPRVSYLSYPDFNRDPHPALAESYLIDLQTFRITHRDYRGVSNPPILHRKEEFVTADYPLREKFAQLTAAEDRVGLYSDTTRIGTCDGWNAVLRSNGVSLRGHRLVRTHAESSRRLPES